MTVSNKDINALSKIPQLEKQMEVLLNERKRIEANGIVAMRKAGKSLRAISNHPLVERSHTQVSNIIKIYEAVNGPIRKDGDQ